MIEEIFASPIQLEIGPFGCVCFCKCQPGDPREDDDTEDLNREVEK